MAEGRSRQLWDHSSQVLAMLGNGLLNRRDGKSFLPWHFNPHLQKPESAISPEEKKESFAMMRHVFTKARR